MSEVLRIWRSSLVDPTNFAIVIATVLLATVSGPFGTLDALPIIPRAIFWTGTIVGAVTIGILVRVAIRLSLPREKKLKAEVFTTLAFSVIFGVVLLVWVVPFASLYRAEDYVPKTWRLFGYIAVITLGLLAVRTYVFEVFQRQAKVSVSEKIETEVQATGDLDDISEPFEPRLMRRLNEEEKSPILWLRSEDHLVEIHTRGGTVKLRMRLADAIDEMEGVEGYCTHRSHWVARSAIVRAEKSGNRWQLVLNNGELVPVTRKYQPRLEAAGVFEALVAE